MISVEAGLAPGPCRAEHCLMLVRLTVASVLVLGATALAGAQEAQRQPPDQATAGPAPAPRPSEAGPFEALGRFVNESISGIHSGVRGVTGSLDDLTGRARETAKEVAKEAGTAVTRLPGTGLVIGREPCVAAPNGAPDCRAATEALCRAKGFETGRSLDVQSERKCPARVWLSGQLPKDDECPRESYVTRALCR